MKRLFPLIFLAFYTIPHAQIAITEVYYDTPYFEGSYTTQQSIKAPESKDHLGEFIELYNYTTEDISLDGWFMSDNYASFYFPQGTIIKSGEFLVVAYKVKPDVPDYFTKFFPTIQGQESKIIYQSNLILNNFKDYVKLYAPLNKDRYQESALPTILLDKAEWADPEYMKNTWNKAYILTHSNYNSKSAEGDGSGIDYYVNSLQKTDKPQENYYKNNYTEQNKTNPLTSLYKPAIIKYEEAPAIINGYKENYALLTWAWYVNQLLNNTCNYGIPIVEQSNSQFVLTDSEQCFTHDTAGNLSSKECLSSQSKNFTDDLQDNPELVKNRIQVYPNPTSSLVTLTWDNEVDNLIAQMRIVSLSGAFDVTVPKNTTGYTYSADLSLQPAGIYILLITLTNGQTFSKNILKL
jgi:hypothetical protein